jgi:rod shape-determining protein MreD
MRWFIYLILAYLAVAVQIALSPFVAYHGAAPNLVLLVVIFIAVNAPKEAALLGCFAIGAMQDLVTQQPPGLFAFSYGLVAMFVVATQQVVYKDHPLTHFAVALAGGILTGFVLLVHAWVRPAAPRAADERIILPAIRLAPTIILTGVLYTAILAPFLLGILQRMKGIFGFQSNRRKGRGW